jgi:outer membrane protein assembly factor BamB
MIVYYRLINANINNNKERKIIMKNEFTIFLLIAVVMVALITVISPVSAADWPQFQFDIASTGNSPADAPDNNTIKWISDDIGAVEGSQAMIVGDKVFVYANDNIYALNRSYGTVLWNTTIPGDEMAWGSWVSPAYDNNVIYISTGFNITKINAQDGTKLQEVAFPNAGYACNGGPTVADGMVFVGSGGNNYYALDENDLTTVIWNYTVPIAGSSSTPAIADGKVVVGELTWAGSSHICCIDEFTGVRIWATELPGNIGGSASIDAANDRTYIVVSTDYTGDAGEIYALNFTTGDVVWNNTITYSDSTPVISGDYLYVSGGVNTPGITYCYDRSGTLQWTVPHGSWTMSPAVADGKLFTGDIAPWGTSDGIYVFDAITGTPVWSYEHAGSSPSIACPDPIVVSVGNDSKVYAFGTKCYDWKEEWFGEGSDGGTSITTTELQDAIHHWLDDLDVRGYIMSTKDLQEIISAWLSS